MRTTLATLIMSALLSALSCLDADPCEIADSIEITSPDNEMNAWVYIRECRSARSRSVHVSVLPSEVELQNVRGNAFVKADEQRVIVRWSGPRDLTIEFEDSGAIYWNETQVGQVHIAYQAR